MTKPKPNLCWCGRDESEHYSFGEMLCAMECNTPLLLAAMRDMCPCTSYHPKEEEV